MTAEGGSYTPFPSFDDWLPMDFDPSVPDRFSALLAEDKAQVTESQLSAAVAVATRYAAVDTGAIEGLYTTSRGFTKTIATMSGAWEAALAQRGDDVARSIEDALAGYEFVLDAATRKTPVTQAWIRELHDTICRSQVTFEVLTSIGPQQQPLPKGVYKTMPNNPTSLDTGRLHHYAPVSDVQPEMARLIDQLGSAAFDAAHPVLQAAYAHYAFVCIHPFADGNGRVSRALASAYLYRSPGAPLVVFADQKDLYIDALEAADSGRHEPFVAFISERVVDTVELIRLSLAGTAESAIADHRRLLQGRGGLTAGEYDAVNRRIWDLVQLSLNELVADLPLPPGVQFSQTLRARPLVAPQDYRSEQTVGIDLALSTNSPAHSVVRCYVLVFSADNEQALADYLVVGTWLGRPLGVMLREVHPVITELFRLKVETWINALLGAGIRSLTNQLTEAAPSTD